MVAGSLAGGPGFPLLPVRHAFEQPTYWKSRRTIPGAWRCATTTAPTSTAVPGDDAWFLRGRSIGNAGPATEVERNSETLRLAGSFGGLVTFLNRTHDYDLGVSWSRSKGIMTDPGTYTERLFLAFRGYGGPGCGVGVVADSSSPAKMRLNTGDTAGKMPGQGDCRYFNPFSNSLLHSAQYGARFEDEANPTHRP